MRAWGGYEGTEECPTAQQHSTSQDQRAGHFDRWKMTLDWLEHKAGNLRTWAQFSNSEKCFHVSNQINASPSCHPIKQRLLKRDATCLKWMRWDNESRIPARTSDSYFKNAACWCILMHFPEKIQPQKCLHTSRIHLDLLQLNSCTIAPFLLLAILPLLCFCAFVFWHGATWPLAAASFRGINWSWEKLSNNDDNVNQSSLPLWPMDTCKVLATQIC